MECRGKDRIRGFMRYLRDVAQGGDSHDHLGEQVQAVTEGQVALAQRLRQLVEDSSFNVTEEEVRKLLNCAAQDPLDAIGAMIEVIEELVRNGASEADVESAFALVPCASASGTKPWPPGFVKDVTKRVLEEFKQSQEVGVVRPEHVTQLESLRGFNALKGQTPPMPTDGADAVDIDLEFIHVNKVIRTAFRATKGTEEERIIREAIRRRIGRGAVRMPDDRTTVYYPVPYVQIKDARGSVTRDPFMGYFKLRVSRSDDETQPFPAAWRVGRIRQVLHSDAADEDEEEGGDDEALSLKKWLERLLALDGRAATDAQPILDVLNRNNITTVEHLRGMSADMLKMLFARDRNGLSLGQLNFLTQKVASLRHDSDDAATDGGAKPPGATSDRELTVVRADLHKLRRFFFYYAGKASLLPLLDPACVRDGLNAVRKGYKNEGLLNLVEKDFLRPLTEYGKMPRGLLFYGPPGTGKTRLLKELTRHCGLEMVDGILTAGELNRPHVGESEELIKDIFFRARRFPYLACVAAIDEIDSAVPKRDESGGGNQHGADKVSAFLGCITGGTDVPNLILAGATNRREAIDEAVRRRLEVSLYVGYLDKKSRGEMITSLLFDAKVPQALNVASAITSLMELFCSSGMDGRVLQDKNAVSQRFPATLCSLTREKVLGVLLEVAELHGQPAQGASALLQDAINRNFCSLKDFWTPFKDDIVDLTMNFSGAGVELVCAALMSAWTTYFRSETVAAWYEVDASKLYVTHARGARIAREQLKGTKQFGILTSALRTVARSLDFRLGTLTVPEILARPDAVEAAAGGLPLPCQNDTGLMLARIIDGRLTVQREHWTTVESGGSGGLASSMLTLLDANAMEMDLLKALLTFADHRGLTRVLHVKRSTLIINGASDEKKQLEELSTAFKQATAPGSQTLLVIDLDSFACEQQNTSEGSMGSVSRSIGKADLFGFIVEKFAELRRPQDPTTRRATTVSVNGEGEAWCVLLSASPFVVKEFRRRDPLWTESPIEASERAAEEEYEKKELTCARCSKTYTKAKNEKEDSGCNYHDKWMAVVKPYDMKWEFVPTMGRARIRQIEIAHHNAVHGQTSEQQGWKVLHTCCFQEVGAQGCKSGRHCGPDKWDATRNVTINHEFSEKLIADVRPAA